MPKIDHETILKLGHYEGLSIDDLDSITVMKLYWFMLRLRLSEEALIREYHPANEMRCPSHFCIGQEAAPAALSLLLKEDDYLFSHHRSHGYFWAKGSSLSSLFAEMYGRETGVNGGIAGSQEISNPSLNMYSGAILAGMPAIAVGTALSFQLKHTSNVAVAGFGDGLPDEGIFWETVNYAVLRKLPVVLLCENNRYATYSPQLKRQPADNISSRVAAFGMRTDTLFGNDVVAVYNALGKAIDYARQGHGPAFVETYTYRWNAHVGPEDDDYLLYRPVEELQFWKRNDPILLLEEQMRANGSLTDLDKQDITTEINAEIAEAFQFAKNSPFPTRANWTELNYSTSSPVADSLLVETALPEFNQDQDYAIPGPY